MEAPEKVQQKLPHQEVDYFKIAKVLLSRWYWIAGSVAVGMIIANVYLWYTPKTFQTSGTMKFEEKKSEIGDLVGTQATTERATSSKIQSETIVLQSAPLLLNAVKHLDYRISFYIKGRVINRTNELYPEKPLNIQLIKFDSLNFFRDLVTFMPVNNTSFSLTYKVGGKDVQKTYKYNTPFSIGPTALSILTPGYMPRTSVYLFKLNIAEDFVGRIRGGLHTGEVGKNSNIISLTQTDANPRFAADALNAVMREYLNYDHQQRTLSASKQIVFIDSQLEFLKKQVAGSENHIEDYKQKAKIMDVASASDRAVNKAKSLDELIQGLNIQLLGIDQLKMDMMREKGNLNLNVIDAGVIDPQLTELIARLNNLEVSKNSQKRTYIANSVPIRALDQQILQAQNDIVTSINASRVLIDKKRKFYADQLVPVNQQLATLPSAERDLESLKRDYEINDKVYSFLSEKKLDAQISSAGILPGAVIIDLAQPNLSPVSPNEDSIHHTATVFGLAIGLGLIILIRMLNPFIYDKETIESLTVVPIIGVIRKFPESIDEYSTQILAISKPKSIFAESVRSVRTNLSFLASEKASKVMCITSEVAGEGKSFVAVNLSSTLSLIDKRVILIAADLRRSKLHKTFHVPNDIGLSNYLANQCTMHDIINKSSQPNLDFIISGPVPPNPSELLHTERMTELITDLKKIYDVIMIDTAPIGLVSDAIPLIRMSDINLFVIRSGKSKFYAATVPQRIAHEYHLDNTVIVLNAFAEDLLHSRYYTTKFTGENYGSRYYYYSDYSGYESSGYYVDEKEKKWWDIRRLFPK